MMVFHGSGKRNNVTVSIGVCLLAFPFALLCPAFLAYKWRHRTLKEKAAHQRLRKAKFEYKNEEQEFDSLEEDVLWFAIVLILTTYTLNRWNLFISFTIYVFLCFLSNLHFANFQFFPLIFMIWNYLRNVSIEYKSESYRVHEIHETSDSIAYYLMKKKQNNVLILAGSAFYQIWLGWFLP